MQRILFNFLLALEGVNANKLRSFLTALGIIFGVSAVIAMLAIGSGAKQSILEQMKLIGTNNIVIKSIAPSSEPGEDQAETTESGGQGQQNQGKRPYSPGLTLEDVYAIQTVLPTVSGISPEMVIPLSIVRGNRLEQARCVGVDNTYFSLNGLMLSAGSQFHDKHLEQGAAVCIIGKDIQTWFFNQEDPIGKQIKCGNNWLRVIGVLQQRAANSENLSQLGIRNSDADIYVPVTAALLRFKNRGLVNQEDLGRNDSEEGRPLENYHQLDRVVVQVDDSRKLRASADLIARLLKRRHQGQVDFEVEVPELLLEQEQKTQDTFNLVLAVIAGISLLVGGIGIMNIMLASVLERIKEIGVRRSLGANQQDIVLQFLFEAVFISLIGGLIGIALGIAAAHTIASYAEIPTIVSAWSILLSFGVAATIGLAFGIFPARKAAQQDPIKSLRSD
ncbi:MAG: ABC transporter permease [Phaeodactylibacter sp.]|nr:ABC transporter permease [Phaeodactylibacter sp.]MCB9050565.1 ABC transporter permease [Lewinellaceae bacterium]